jgi:hypothetical protein
MFSSLVLAASLVFSPATPPAKEKVDFFHLNLSQVFGKEYPVILKAAKRNDIEEWDYENLAILFAIRKAENGAKGREFGVISNPRAIGKDHETWEVTLDRQAGWASATIMKNRVRWKDAGCKEPFVTFLARRYAPVGAENDPNGLNRHWLHNVNSWKTKFMKFAKQQEVA